MKHLLSPLVLSLLLFAGTNAALAATKAASVTVSRMMLDTGGGSIFVTSTSGLGFTGKAPSAAKSATRSTPTPVDIRFNAEPQSEGMARALAYLSGKNTALDATLKLLDFNYAVTQQIDLGNSAIVELELPGANATEAKRPAVFRMRLQPNQLSVQPGAGSVVPEMPTKSKQALGSNFRVSINDVAEPSVIQVLPAVVKRTGKDLQISGLGVALPQAQAFSGEWQKWSALALAGGEPSEKTLRVEYLDAALTTVLLTLEYTGVGIISMDVPGFEANSNQVARVTFGLYARGVSIK
jgi:hypothetical protein